MTHSAPSIHRYGCSDFQRLLGRVTMMKKRIGLVMLLSIGLLIGFNTIHGAFQDIERGGEALSETAKEVQKSM
jgi:predicted small secreted protein